MTIKKYLVEFIGTFFLVLVVGQCVIDPGAGLLAPLAIGATLMVMVYAGGHISGGHYNPAVTLAVFLRGKCDKSEVPGYMIAQFIGSGVAAALVGFFKQGSIVVASSPDIFHAFLAEIVFTFALAYVVLNTATAKGTEGNSFYGLAIGFTVMVGAYAVGSISGGAFNPAVALGITLMGISKFQNLWMFLVANFSGGALAAVVFKYVNSQER